MKTLCKILIPTDSFVRSFNLFCSNEIAWLNHDKPFIISDLDLGVLEHAAEVGTPVEPGVGLLQLGQGDRIVHSGGVSSVRVRGQNLNF